MTSPPKSTLRHHARTLLLETAIGRFVMVVPRAGLALKAAGIGPRLGAIARWAVTSREHVNFTYDTTRDSQRLLCAAIAEIAGCPTSEVVDHLDQLLADRDLIAHVETVSRSPASRHRVDPGFKPGRRIAFYLLARVLKPRFVVEAGVDRGLGALLISHALNMNAAEGFPGDYLGIEFDAEKPIPLYQGYPHRVGNITRGDSIAVVAALDRPIDLFIHDTTTEPAHVSAQLAAVAQKRSPHGVIASTWSMPQLTEFALRGGLGILTHQEEPVGHWFSGDRVAMVFPRRLVTRSNGDSITPPA